MTSVFSPTPFELPPLEFGGAQIDESLLLENAIIRTQQLALESANFNFHAKPHGHIFNDRNRTIESSIPSSAEAIRVGYDDDKAPPPPLSEWAHKPLCIVPSKLTSVTRGGTIEPSVPFQFESDLFIGTAIIRIATDEVINPNDAEEAEEQARPKHRFQVAIQGRFKQPLDVADVVTGQVFEKELRNLPPRWMVEAGSALIRRLSPGVELDLYSNRPRMLANLAATAKEMRADRPGLEPCVTSFEFEEHSESLLAGEGVLSGRSGGITASKRKKHLSDPEAATQLEYDTETVYTFNFYQEMLDLETFSVDLGFVKLSIAESLNGQPIQILARTRDGRYLWCFQIWHEELVRNGFSR